MDNYRHLITKLGKLEAEHKKQWGGSTEESKLIAEAEEAISTLCQRNARMKRRIERAVSALENRDSGRAWQLLLPALKEELYD